MQFRWGWNKQTTCDYKKYCKIGPWDWRIETRQNPTRSWQNHSRRTQSKGSQTIWIGSRTYSLLLLLSFCYRAQFFCVSNDVYRLTVYLYFILNFHPASFQFMIRFMIFLFLSLSFYFSIVFVKIYRKFARNHKLSQIMRLVEEFPTIWYCKKLNEWLE